MPDQGAEATGGSTRSNRRSAGRKSLQPRSPSPATEEPTGPARPAAPARPGRLVIEALTPEIDGGLYPIKRVAGERVVVEIDAYAEGHDEIRCKLSYRKAPSGSWIDMEMEHVANDRWRGEFVVAETGQYRYTAAAWIDRFRTWRRDLARWFEAGQGVAAELPIGAELLAAAADGADDGPAQTLRDAAAFVGDTKRPVDARARAALDPTLLRLMDAWGSHSDPTSYPRELAVLVDRPRAAFSSWYEVFPRSCSDVRGRHGTFADCAGRIPYIADMGFDVLYLPPIHPIGRTSRKGRNNTLIAERGDPGSPWAIGGPEGGHKAIHTELGTIDDFRTLLRTAADAGMEVALDLAFQCSPDHPYVSDHPEWFRRRPDGSVRHAENPPKKYEDIVPFDFECEDWRALWNELRDVVMYWVGQGVRIFRVDNPHTKPFRFWEWLISEVKGAEPDVLFLSEAFTRPKVMYQLAKAGFTQSYTYFAWRNTNHELTKYFRELTSTDVVEFFRPNLWPNTPDILTEYLQNGGRAAFQARLVLAATLGASYGIYGPAFELCESTPRTAGSEEYLHSEKYEIRTWDLDAEHSLRDLITRVNRIRREHRSLQSDRSLHFHATSNERLLCYSKRTDDGEDIILTVVNLDPHYTQSGWLHVSDTELGVEPGQAFQAHDLLGGARFAWQGHEHYVELSPDMMPGHIFAIRRKLRSERDFEYYL